MKLPCFIFILLQSCVTLITQPIYQIKHYSITPSQLQIAYVTGFSDPKYFSKCFKKVIGTTPTEYKEKKNSLKE